MDTPVTFGLWLRQRRRVLDLTQDELARRAGCSVSAIRKLEADERRPSLQVARMLAAALQIAPHERAAFLLAARTEPGAAAQGAPLAHRTMVGPATAPATSAAATTASHRGPTAAPPATLPATGPSAAPAPTMLADSPGLPRLPAPLTSFVGRQHELAEVRALLSRRDAPVRLLTLTGPGGSGKTRLALEAAAPLADHFPAGIGWVELGILAEDELVPQAVAAALGVKETPPTPIEVTLAAHLKPHRTLIVLDNCEHLVQACAELAASLLRQCPGLQILATSRAALQILGEVTVNVPPLALPQVEDVQDPRHLQEIESVRLLVERAQAVRSDFALTQANSAAVVEICRRLDGIPLALELAATRLRALTPEQLAARLDDRFRLLTGGSRTALPRQQTLRALIGWSHDLLSGTEQTLFRRLAVFAGGCTLEAAEAVCSFGVLAWSDVLDLLTSLVDKSLLTLREEEDGMRYVFLETIREYALEQLALAGETQTLHVRHFDFYLGLAEVGGEIIFAGREQPSWLRRLQRDQDNLRAALDWSLDAAPVQAVQLAGALWSFWNESDQIMEGHTWLQRALDAGGGAAPVARRARGVSGLATMFYRRNEFGRAAELHREALDLFRQAGDWRGEAVSLNNLAAQLTLQGDYETPVALFHECLAIAQPQDDFHVLYMANCNLGLNHLYSGRLDIAEPTLLVALAAARRTENPMSVGTILHNLGELALRRGDEQAAYERFQESEEQLRPLNSNLGIGVNAWGRGVARYRQGQFSAAIAEFQKALVHLAAAASRMHVVDSLEWLALALVEIHGTQPAIRLLGAASALRQEMGYQVVAAMPQENFDRKLAELRDGLGGEEFRAAWDAGSRTSMEQAIEHALSLQP
jgi:predicted ATPase/DNA-binding XRE family transcriptional regulator